MAKILKLRKSEIRTFHWLDSNDPTISKLYDEGKLTGTEVYVIEVSPQGKPTYIELRLAVPRTNLSNEPREHGWLGTTDNVYRYSHGKHIVVGESSTHLHLEPVTSGEE